MLSAWSLCFPNDKPVSLNLNWWKTFLCGYWCSVIPVIELVFHWWIKKGWREVQISKKYGKNPAKKLISQGRSGRAMPQAWHPIFAGFLQFFYCFAIQSTPSGSTTVFQRLTIICAGRYSRQCWETIMKNFIKKLTYAYYLLNKQCTANWMYENKDLWCQYGLILYQKKSLSEYYQNINSVFEFREFS